MGVKIRIQAGAVAILGELHDTETAQAIAAALPLEATTRIWGEEIYFTIPVHQPLDQTATALVGAGDIGYWPTGPALCLFFGPTPISSPGEIRPASAVNIVGRLDGDLRCLHEVQDGIIIKVEPLTA
ncbi:MAG: cyclophilin-like fold protein [Desulfobacca sp.]|uniref:cyclophilin-like fold protein n=1 Tax=Desulfobacca sp. TaxID=2067990 RepID=UPI00404AE0B0